MQSTYDAMWMNRNRVAAFGFAVAHNAAVSSHRRLLMALEAAYALCARWLEAKDELCQPGQAAVVVAHDLCLCLQVQEMGEQVVPAHVKAVQHLQLVAAVPIEAHAHDGVISVHSEMWLHSNSAVSGQMRPHGSQATGEKL